MPHTDHDVASNMEKQIFVISSKARIPGGDRVSRDLHNNIHRRSARASEMYTRCGLRRSSNDDDPLAQHH